MEKSYKVISYSKWRFVTLLLISFLTMLPATIFFLRFGIIGQIIMGFWAVILSIFPFFILPKYIAKSILTITIDTKNIYFDCVKPYWGCKHKKTFRICLDLLKSFKYEPSYNFSTLKLRLKTGETIKLHRWYNDDNDDFSKFMTQFRRTVENYNQKKSTITVIEKEKLIMENRTFLIVTGVLIGIIFIASIFLLIFKGVSNWKGIIYLLIVLFPLVWVIIQIVKGLHKN